VASTACVAPCETVHPPHSGPGDDGGVSAISALAAVARQGKTRPGPSWQPPAPSPVPALPWNHRTVAEPPLQRQRQARQQRRRQQRLSFVAVPAPAPVIAAEKAALLSFRRGVAGDPFDELSSWAAGSTPCAAGWSAYETGWIGVKCTQNGGFVSMVTLTTKGIKGNITDLAVLQKLTRLDLFMSKDVVGDVSTLGGLADLQFLDLFGTAVAGSFDALSSLASLGLLRMPRTAVVGSVASLENLTQLTWIELEDCGAGVRGDIAALRQ
jgi:hypothetical protein